MIAKPYQKKIMPYFLAGSGLGFVGFVINNWFEVSPLCQGVEFLQKVDLLLSSEGYLELLANFPAYLFHMSLMSCGVAMTLLFFVLMAYIYGNDHGTYRLGEEYGSARFATDKEITRYADKEQQYNMILSRQVRMGIWNSRIPRAFQKNKNVCVIGDSGSGKTFTFVKPNILQCLGSFVVTDPKGLLVHETGTILEREGYKIKVLDLNTLANSDQFNVFKYIKREIDLDRVLEAITEGTKKSDKQGEDFWIQAEAILIRSFIAYLWFDGQDNHYDPQLSMIAEMIRIATPPNPKEKAPVDAWFEEQNLLHPNNYAYRQWKLFEQSFEAETRSSVMAIAAARYSVFDHKDVADLVSRDTMDIESWLEEKTAVFIAIPETNSAYNFIASIFISTIMETLRSKIDRILAGDEKLSNGQDPLFMQYIIDEFANLGRIPNIDKALATFRSRNMSIIIILQALAQLKEMYKDGWAAMLNNCATLLFLGGDEKETTKYLSERAGKQTIRIRNHSSSRGKSGNSTENKQSMARDLMTPDEIGRLNGDECLLYITKEYVYKDFKYNCLKHPRAGLLANSYKDKELWYTYKRYKTDIEELLDNVRIVELEDVDDEGVQKAS